MTSGQIVGKMEPPKLLNVPLYTKVRDHVEFVEKVTPNRQGVVGTAATGALPLLTDLRPVERNRHGLYVVLTHAAEEAQPPGAPRAVGRELRVRPHAVGLGCCVDLSCVRGLSYGGILLLGLGRRQACNGVNYKGL